MILRFVLAALALPPSVAAQRDSGTFVVRGFRFASGDSLA